LPIKIPRLLVNNPLPFRNAPTRYAQVNATTFEVHHAEENNKVYKFITKDELTAKHWVDAINAVKL
jgi:hypothetical protein